MILFSIVVPIYNVEQYLDQCIQSVLNQSFANLQLILVNDGSTDSSLEICKRYLQKDNRIQIIDKPNGGLVSARKAGMRLAKGDYIICLDGDDYISFDLLETISSSLVSKEYDVICYGYYKDNNGKITECVYYPLDEGIYNVRKDIVKYYLYDSTVKTDNYGKILFSAWSKAVKKDLYVRAQEKVPENIKNGEDVLLTANIVEIATEFAVLNYCGYYYRYNPTSLTHKRIPFDLINLFNVSTFLQKCNKIPIINISHYYLSSAYILTSDMAKQCSSYKEFITIIRKENWYNDKLHNVNFTVLGIRKRFIYFSIRKKLWLLIYVISRFKR